MKPRQKSAPIGVDEFTTPLRNIKSNFEPYKSSSSEENSKISDPIYSDSSQDNIGEVSRDFYGIEYIINQEQIKEGDNKTNSKKLQSEIDALKFPSEIIEFHLKDKLFKYIVNNKLEEFITELEKLKDPNGPAPKKKDSDPNLLFGMF